MRNSTKGALFFIAIVVVIVAIIGNVVINAASRIFTNKVTYGEEIGMCQPSGWNLTRDAKCAQDVNVPNSVANLNNGQSRVYNAQATAIVETSDNTLRTQYVGGLGLGCIAALVFGPVGLFLFALLIARSKRNEQ